MKTLTGKRVDLEKKVSKIISKEIKDLSKKQDKVVLGIPGGRSIVGIFKLLTKEKIDWSKVHIFMVDERRLPITSEDSNYSLAEPIFSKVMGKEHLHPYNYKRPVKDYSNDLLAHGGRFDIILLSAGEDGHVAGLFPNYTIKKKDDSFFTFDNSPKPPRKRMTASRKLLAKTHVAILLFFGEGKRQAYEMFNDKSVNVNKCPAKLVYGIKETYVVSDIE